MLFLSSKKNKVVNRRKVICLLLIVFLFSIFTIKMVTAEQSINKELNILEIQPGDNFIIKGDKNLNKTGIDTKIVRGYEVNIEHISMPEFIGRTDQLNGKYDVIVIGRNYNEKNNNDRDYSGIKNDGKEVNGTINSGDDSLLPTGNYVENDITNRKAKEIKEFIKSGQMVYIQNSILTGKKAVENSNLKGYFENDESNNLIRFFYDRDIAIGKIVEKYIDGISGNLADVNNNQIIIKNRPRISVTCSEGDSINDSNGDGRKRYLKFNVNIPEDTDKYTVKLFLDINGDGVFSEKECYERENNVEPQENYNISHYIGSQFIGWLQWKIEVEKSYDNGGCIKSYVTDNIYFKKLKDEHEKYIKVLQIYPDNYGLKLEDNEIFQEKCKVDDYNINIESMSTNDFNDKAGKSLKLNGNYHMIIIGFKDGYGGKDIKNKEALDEIESFIKSGQSVMFTHDTMALRMKSPYSASVELTERFRDFIGQSRFLDGFKDSNDISTDENEPNYIYTHDAYEKYDTDEGTYKERKIPHIDLDENNKKVVGYSINGKKNIEYDNTFVYKTNSGLINNYPYKLEDTIQVASTHNQWYQLNLEDPDVVPWYNLQSAKPDTKINKYDCRSNYYTYSKGNITYSGTGHSNSDGYDNATEEFELFVNTIVKAERGANHAPIINCSIENEISSDDANVKEVNYSQNYYFSVNASDYENDMVSMSVKVEGIDISEENMMSDIQFKIAKDEEEKDCQVFEIKTSDLDRDDVRIKIPAAKLQEAFKNDKTVIINIKAFDTQKAVSTKTYVLKPVKSKAGIDVQFQSATPTTAKYGQSITVKYEVTPNEYYYNSNASSGDMINEAIFLVDKSSDMGNFSNRLAQVKSNITEVINDDNLKEIKLGMIGFDENSIVWNRREENDPKSSEFTETNGDISKLEKPLYVMNDENIKDGFRQSLQEDKLKPSHSATRNLDNALKVADNIFEEFGGENDRKAIIIISSGNVSYTDDEINKIRKKGYKIISLDISGDLECNIQDIHKKLGGSDDEFIVSENDKGIFNYLKSDMKKIAKYLKSGTFSSRNIISSAQFNFNLGDFFEPQDDSCLKSEGGNKYTLDVTNDINYVKTDEISSDKGIKYKAEPIEVVFTIKLKDKQYKGNLGFNTKSYSDEQYINQQLANGTYIDNGSDFKYKVIDDLDIKPLTIKTPVIKIKKTEIQVEHGVYKGFNKDSGPDIDSDEKSFAKCSTVNFGAYFTGVENNEKIKLIMDGKIKSYKIDKIYYIDNYYNRNTANGTFNDNLEYTVSDLPNGCSRVLVLYHEILPDESSSTYTNYVKIIDEPNKFPATIKSSEENITMPDLF